MKYRKLLLTFVLAAVMAFAGTGCADKNETSKETEEVKEPEKEESKKEEAEKEEPEKEKNEPADTEKEPEEDENNAVLHKAYLYIPDENAEGWERKETEMEQITADALIGQLVGEGVLMDSILVQDFEEVEDAEGYRLNLDLSATFLETLRSMGSSGEFFTLGAVVNSFLDTYEADSIKITVDGNVLETGHNVYDSYISHMEP